jgi:negative regulator of flagellin synthesis FlgM
MHIYGPASLHSPQSVSAPHAPRFQGTEAASPPSVTVDELSLSDAAQLVDRVRDLPDIRQSRVDALRAAIADGTYETSDKLDAAVERLLDEIA